ncbi:MAG: BatD family protein [Proteobacteria bacterium]|nr:BatD family protein [Pseudomonadota bacterium]MBU1057656.1 BatD family protein [Pseudomonadota bacterium]
MKKMRRHFNIQNGRRIGVVALCFLVVLLVAEVMPVQSGVQVSASLNATSFPIDRVAALTITVKGTRSFEPQMPEVDGLQFQQRGQSTQIEMINGDFSASVTTVYLVQGLREGKFTIPAIPISTKEGRQLTQPIDFEITASQSAAVSSSAQSPSSSKPRLRSGEAEQVAFMRVTLNKEKSYSGEVVPVQIKAYFREGIKANLNTLPQVAGEGFVLQQLAPEPVQTREIVNNAAYTVLEWDSTLSGIKEGQHRISLELEATLLLPEQRRRSLHDRSLFDDPFMGDSFFDNFFGRYLEKEVKVVSPELDLEVLSLPEEGRPQEFHGAIGEFHLSVSGDPLEVEPGEPITLTMTVKGKGNFDRVQAPELDEDEGWKSYSPSSEFLEDGGMGQGKKVFEQALVARDPHLQEIPAVTFAYFDPTAAAYTVLKSPPIPFKIKGTAVEERKLEPKAKAEQMEKVQPEMAAPVDPPISNLAPLKLQSDAMEQTMVPLFFKRWFQVLVVLFVVLVLVAAVLKQRAARNANNPRLQQHQAMKHLLNLRQKEIEQALAANDSRGFLGICRRAIQEQLGLLWHSEAGAITLADLTQRLGKDSFLITIFSAAEESAYGGQELNSQQMQDFADRLQKELEGLL